MIETWIIYLIIGIILTEIIFYFLIKNIDKDDGFEEFIFIKVISCMITFPILLSIHYVKINFADNYIDLIKYVDCAIIFIGFVLINAYIGKKLRKGE